MCLKYNVFLCYFAGTVFLKTKKCITQASDFDRWNFRKISKIFEIIVLCNRCSRRIFIWINVAFAHTSSVSAVKKHILCLTSTLRGCLAMPSSCILGPITWFHSSEKIAPIHKETTGRRGREKKPPTHNHVFSIDDGKVDDNMTIVL